MSRVGYIGLGSNMGDRLEWLRRAMRALDAHPGLVLHESSGVFETRPMYVLDQPSFLNACARITTALSPEHTLAALLEVEHALGRRRDVDKGPRTLDLDLLLVEGVICDSPQLTLPHPGLHERAFVLVPLGEIAPGLVHPTLGETIETLRNQCEGVRDVVRFGVCEE